MQAKSIMATANKQPPIANHLKLQTAYASSLCGWSTLANRSLIKDLCTNINDYACLKTNGVEIKAAAASLPGCCWLE